MAGRVLAAIEDAGGGYKDEALRKLRSANQDLGSREYSPKTCWIAHYWYGKVLLDNGYKKDAGKYLTLAQQDAQSLTVREQKQTQEQLDRLQKK